MEMFRNSRLRLTLAYSLTMCVFSILLIVLILLIMGETMVSEQEQELSDAAEGIAEAQAYHIQHPNAAIDENRYYRNTNDRLFFYIFDENENLIEFVRASFKIEPFVLERMKPKYLNTDKAEVFNNDSEPGRTTQIMMISKKIRILDVEQTIYVGKDVTAIYSGLKKSIYMLISIGFLAMIITTIIGYIIAGRALIPLKNAYDSQKQFTADASHELRTPLAVIMTSTDLLLSDPSIQNPFLRDIIVDVKDEVKKMTKLVGDLLMLARSDNDRLKLKIQKLNLVELLEQNVRMMTPLAEKKGVILVGKTNGKVTIDGDEEKIKQLILILVDNAVKYTPEGGNVAVRLEDGDDSRAVFSVQDSGIGIAPEDQEKIFERFYRVDKARSREMGGNGLGLSIATEILRLHDGKISVDSKLGVGTKFTVALKKHLKAEHSE